MLLRTDRHLPAVQLSVSISLNLCIHVFSQYLKFNVSLNTSLIIPSAYTYPPSCLTTVNKSCDWSIQSSIVLPLLLNRFLHITKCISLNCKAKMHLSLNNKHDSFQTLFSLFQNFLPILSQGALCPLLHASTTSFPTPLTRLSRILYFFLYFHIWYLHLYHFRICTMVFLRLLHKQNTCLVWNCQH